LLSNFRGAYPPAAQFLPPLDRFLGGPKRAFVGSLQNLWPKARSSNISVGDTCPRSLQKMLRVQFPPFDFSCLFLFRHKVAPITCKHQISVKVFRFLLIYDTYIGEPKMEGGILFHPQNSSYR
jgi:hypothetical protein